MENGSGVVCQPREFLREPHGRSDRAVLLADLRRGERAEILCVYEKDGKFLEFLEGLELRPLARVEVKNREYDETMTLRSGGRTMHLGKPATSRIWVRRLGAPIN